MNFLEGKKMFYPILRCRRREEKNRRRRDMSSFTLINDLSLTDRKKYFYLRNVEREIYISHCLLSCHYHIFFPRSRAGSKITLDY